MANEQSEFWSKIAQRYDKIVDSQIGLGIWSMVRERVAKEGNLGHLAEFGCGTGFFTQLLSSKANRIVAADLFQGMLSLAKKNVTATNVTFRLEDCQRTFSA